MLIFSCIYGLLALASICYIVKHKKRMVYITIPLFIIVMIVVANLKSAMGVFGLGGFVYFIGMLLQKVDKH